MRWTADTGFPIVSLPSATPLAFWTSSLTTKSLPLRRNAGAGAKRSLSFGRITGESVFYAIFEYPQVSKFVYEYLKSPHNQRSAPCSLRPNLQVRYAERRGSNSQPSPRNKLSAPLGLLLQQLPQRRTDGVLRYVLPSRMEWVPLEREGRCKVYDPSEEWSGVRSSTLGRGARGLS